MIFENDKKHAQIHDGLVLETVTLRPKTVLYRIIKKKKGFRWIPIFP